MKKYLPFQKNVKIGILIDNFRVMFRILTELNTGGFKFELLEPNKPIPPDVSIVLISPNLNKSSLFEEKIQLIEISGEINNLITCLLLKITKKKLFDCVLIGVDPGIATGLAIIADGCVLFAEVIPENELIYRILELLNKFPAKSHIVKIGDGGVISENFYLQLFSKIPQNVIVQRVNESKSSTQFLSGSTILNRDQGAAIRIARRDGKSITTPPNINISSGMIREIQNQSRKISEGRVTISRSLAKRVCRGELSIQEAVNQYICQ